MPIKGFCVFTAVTFIFTSFPLRWRCCERRMQCIIPRMPLRCQSFSCPSVVPLLHLAIFSSFVLQILANLQNPSPFQIHLSTPKVFVSVCTLMNPPQIWKVPHAVWCATPRYHGWVGTWVEFKKSVNMPRKYVFHFKLWLPHRWQLQPCRTTLNNTYCYIFSHVSKGVWQSFM